MSVNYFLKIPTSINILLITYYISSFDKNQKKEIASIQLEWAAFRTLDEFIIGNMVSRHKKYRGTDLDPIGTGPRQMSHYERVLFQTLYKLQLWRIIMMMMLIMSQKW